MDLDWGSQSRTAGASLQAGSDYEVLLIGSREFRAARLVNRNTESETEFSGLDGALLVFGAVIPGRITQICITGAPGRNRTCCLNGPELGQGRFGQERFEFAKCRFRPSNIALFHPGCYRAHAAML